MRLTRIRHHADRDRGAAAVEFALIAPVLIVLLLGIINAGYLFGQKLALNQAVREGARHAVVKATSAQPVGTLVRNAAGTSLISDPANISVSWVGGCSAPGIGNDLQVSASYPTKGIVPMPIPGFSSMTLHSQAVFRCEW